MHILLTLGTVLIVAICGIIAYVFYLAPSPSDDLK
jgi:hypothetical protein